MLIRHIRTKVATLYRVHGCADRCEGLLDVLSARRRERQRIAALERREFPVSQSTVPPVTGEFGAPNGFVRQDSHFFTVRRVWNHLRQAPNRECVLTGPGKLSRKSL
jgi:hypothetical protein